MGDQVGQIFSSVIVDFTSVKQEAESLNVVLKKLGITLGNLSKKADLASGSFKTLGSSFGNAKTQAQAATGGFSGLSSAAGHVSKQTIVSTASVNTFSTALVVMSQRAIVSTANIQLLVGTIRYAGNNFRYAGQQAQIATGPIVDAGRATKYAGDAAGGGGGVGGGDGAAGKFYKFGESMARTLSIAIRYYAAYGLITTAINSISKTIKDLQDLEMESIFIKPALSGENMASVLKEIIPLSQKWGIDLIESFRGVQQISRSLSDMYEMDLPAAIALTDVAMKITAVSGQNLNETISNMVGYIRLLRIESVGDIEKFMSTIYSAAYLTNEALTKSGKSISGGALAMDTLTDAIQRMLPGLLRFGMSQEQIAAVASVFVTNLDEAGQGIGGYSAKLFEAIKSNKILVQTYKEIGIELERGDNLLGQMASGWQKMNDRQKDAIAKSLQIGMGVHATATFLESLTQIQERANWLQENNNLLNIKAIEIMGTLQKKQDQLKVSLQALGIEAGQVFIPIMKSIIDVLRILTSVSGGVAQALPKTFDDYIKVVQGGGSALLIEGIKKGIKDLADPKDYQKAAENIKMVRRHMEAAMTGGTVGGVMGLESSKDIVKEFTRDINMATYALGPYASETEIAALKVSILEGQLEKLQEVLYSMTMAEGLSSEAEIREQQEAIRKTVYEIEKQRKAIQEYNNEQVNSFKYRAMEVNGFKEELIIQQKINDLIKEKNQLESRGISTSGLQEKIDSLRGDALIISEKTARNELERLKNFELSYKYLDMESQGYNNIVIQKEKIRDLEKEILELKKDGNDIGKNSVEIDKKGKELDNERLELKKQIVQEQTAISDNLKNIVSSGLMDIINKTATWEDILSNVGEYVLEKIIEKLIEATILNAALNALGGALSGFLGGTLHSGGEVKGSTIPSGEKYHIGGVIKDLNRLPSFQVGGEVPVLAQAGEFVVRNGPSQSHRKLLEDINSGKDIGSKPIELTVVNVVDSSFVSASIKKDPRTVINVIDQNLLMAGSTRRILKSDFGG
jgi:hypothetical protein